MIVYCSRSYFSIWKFWYQQRPPKMLFLEESERNNILNMSPKLTEHYMAFFENFNHFLFATFRSLSDMVSTSKQFEPYNHWPSSLDYCLPIEKIFSNLVEIPTSYNFDTGI